MTAVKKVDFLVAGAQKSGTSALDAYLREHPELCFPRQKELHFFDKDRLFASGHVDYAAYHAHFDPRPPQHLLGESTPAYLYWPQAVERIARYNPTMLIIVVLRNPITRAYSHWNMVRQWRSEPLSFLGAVSAEAERMRTLSPRRRMQIAYVDRGFYCRQLKRLWQHIPREQTVVFKSDDLLASPRDVLERTAKFLDIAPFPSPSPRAVHIRDYGTTMSGEEKRHLVGIFRDEIAELERLLHWDCSSWFA